MQCWLPRRLHVFKWETQYNASVCDNVGVFNLLIKFPNVQADTRLSVVMSGTSSAICWVNCVRKGRAFKVDDDEDNDDNDDDDDDDDDDVSDFVQNFIFRQAKNLQK